MNHDLLPFLSITVAIYRLSADGNGGDSDGQNSVFIKREFLFLHPRRYPLTCARNGEWENTRALQLPRLLKMRV